MAEATTQPPELDGDERANILVVDDLPDKLLAFEAVLEELGQNLVMVNSGADALRELLEREFAVILLDVNMPDIDGIETAEFIRKHKKTAHIPIIFVTAYADEMQTARGYELGAVDYILSPIVPEILRAKVRVFVELYRAQRRAQSLARVEAERAAAQEAMRRSDYLAFASHELGASLNLEEGMERFLQILVPGLAQFALLLVQVDDDALLMSCDGAGSPGTPRTQIMADLKGLPEALVHGIEQGALEGHRSELQLAAADALMGQVRFFQIVPLKVGNRTIAVLGLGYARDLRSQGEAEQAMIGELVSHAAIALENSRLYWNLTREMERAREAEEQLQQASRRKDEFLAMLSHELRNPLAPIRNAAEALRRIAPTDAGIAWAGEVIERQVTQLAHLVDDLLDVARITEGKITLQKERIELGKVIRHSIDTTRMLFDSKRHSLAVNLPDAPIWVYGDFARLAQVVGNILNNAAKYTDEGGHIELSASADHGEAVIDVRDDGIGIDSSLVQHVFELFTQGKRSLDRSQGGLGVGLTVVQRLVELHQGRVEVRSEGLGKGARFTVVLPCISGVSQEQGESQTLSDSVATPGGQRILVVDDNLDAAESIAVLLRLEGHEVRTAGDGPQAVAIAQAFAPQVVLLDIGLPGMDGYEVARQLRQKVADGPLLLIALSGYGREEDRGRSVEVGFDHHLVKPAHLRTILATINAWHREAKAGASSQGNFRASLA